MDNMKIAHRKCEDGIVTTVFENGEKITQRDSNITEFKIIKNKNDSTMVIVLSEHYRCSGTFNVMNSGGGIINMEIIDEEWETCESSTNLMELIDNFSKLVE